MLNMDTKLYGQDNLTLLTDFYEITMANGFFGSGKSQQCVHCGNFPC